MNVKKSPGRPRSFDAQQALLAAIETFWAHGYNGTSMKDLAKAMGINAPSIYGAFGDKRSLYLQAIDRYADVDACAPVVAFETEPDITKAVEGFLRAVIEHATSPGDGPRGCFLASCVSVSVGEVEGVAERLEHAIEATDVRLAARFDAEKAKGTLPPDFPSKERARLMFDMRQGYVFRGRAGRSAQSLLQDLDHRVRMILATSTD